MMQSESIGALAAALAKAQGEIKGALKDSQNPHFKSKYADLASIWEACREPLSKNQLAVLQTNDGDGEKVEVLTTLAHSSGEWMRGRLVMRPVKADPQGIGSAITYARRYALAAMVGVAPDDDDGEAAQGRATNGNGHARPPQQAPKAAAPAAQEITADGAAAFVNALRLKLAKCHEPADVDYVIQKHGAQLAAIKAAFEDRYDEAMKAAADVKTAIQNDPVRLRAAG